MALVNEHHPFNPDQLDNPVIGFAARTAHHDSGMHQHRMSQLLYAPSGCMSITLDNKQCVLPPTLAAWIPAGIQHCAVMRNVVAYRSIFFNPDYFADLPDQVVVIGVNELLKAMIERIAFWPWDENIEQQAPLLTLFQQELLSAPTENLQLPFPCDQRLQHWLETLKAGKQLPEPLNIMSRHVGASEKTISRIFQQETGMPYQSWRQQWRLLKAIELLAEQHSVMQVASALGFSSDSAFVSFFRKQTGTTPGQYIQ
ncbi:AraC family transcriptional regulator [Endozoicomonas euniceicola]|uniref:Helix-turn-helix transcriptional regulator n=1 Tax=Endozoicomonas euniceicola TaxID=1234143 RepID=A0ABY6GMG2_9GAMM|nr:helix-turn-helix transcriptional regulator [Endozoicomonas euniceicola]UYM13872.1 helix-turn-helix transcriptional regulator [Endozoicomonas euniceicola]